MRVGLHTGSAVVAHGGGTSQDVFGDTPNIAARVESAAEPDTVLITAATHPYTQALLSAMPRLEPGQRLERIPFDAAGFRPMPLREVAPGHFAAIV